MTDKLDEELFEASMTDKTLPRNKKYMKRFLEGYPWASCKEINQHFGNKLGNKGYIQGFENFNVYIPLDDEILDLLMDIEVEVSLSVENLTAMLSSDGEMYRQPKGTWYMRRGKKKSLEGKLTSINFNLVNKT